MGRTIIQPIGPLYGETVNGTVFGRPNGSVFVPSENTISLSINVEYVRVTSWEGNISLCDATGYMFDAECLAIATSQDTASYIQVQLSDDVTFATFAFRTYQAGSFNINNRFIAIEDKTNVTITGGSTHYLRAVLFASSGVPIATSDVKEVTGWVSE